ncbi:MAG: class I SAM-dependent methyltransferase, partial [Deltaproteobacteria bacterium]|nr:class I SAM-dependent methyltransferase [Deltaproteobacteria bacterium]
GLAVALDIDVEALMEARRRDPSLALVIGDLTHLPFRSESLDLTWNSSTLEHLGEPLIALEEMARVTRTGGMLFVGVPYLCGPLGFQRWIQRTTVGIWIGTTFDLRQLKQLFLQAHTTPQHHIFYFFRFFIGLLARK